ncbi:TetR/AcrR family transcriptional regulator [Tsukamurella tyrosinosolvens]|uniref:TetR/AcrR family transcriptional regulator n=1 Tax=Tsukamurella tyrosinosolvens TaxID=57704 RepID=UPI000791AA36|nr:TetR/AcrR family transcriptional regulator [Tsukamurella tyrosinosolvens]KXP05555.1 hypothetical protein AXK59_08400 [Tsukamurella tyrosinosolvens]KZL95373.1 hypothetical protein AXX05_19425 [Tsukamurella tyrosinosolvens]MCA4993880.1 TetR/AcrR family transcriptional regulator [Tsukamurella tyrosinosolvens]
MPRTPASLRGPGSPGIRDHLVEVTRRLIAERRAAGLTVRAIAREADVASGVIYNYFDDKEDLLAQGFLAHLDTVERTLPRPPRPGEDTLEGNLTTYVEYLLALHDAILPAFAGLLAHPEAIARFQAMPASDKGGDLHQHVESHLRAERDLGRIRAGVDTASAASLLIGACYELVLPQFGRDVQPRQERDRWAARLVETLLDGCRG